MTRKKTEGSLWPAKETMHSIGFKPGELQPSVQTPRREWCEGYMRWTGHHIDCIFANSSRYWHQFLLQHGSGLIIREESKRERTWRSSGAELTPSSNRQTERKPNIPDHESIEHKLQILLRFELNCQFPLLKVTKPWSIKCSLCNNLNVNINFTNQGRLTKRIFCDLVPILPNSFVMLSEFQLAGALTGKYTPANPPSGPRGRIYTPAFLTTVSVDVVHVFPKVRT